jgi:predicted methyltransferase
MNKKINQFKNLLVAVSVLGLMSVPAAALGSKSAKKAAPKVAQDLQQIILGNNRTARNMLRDKYRHPGETLSFLGLTSDMTVVEIWPGGGWYTEILAPYLKDNGTYVAAHLEANKDSAYAVRSLAGFNKKLKNHPEYYSKVTVTELGKNKQVMTAAGQADMVVSFRNVHNWMGGGYSDKIFTAAFKALKPGGVFGVIEHRAKPDAKAGSGGYVLISTVVKYAKAAGFILEASSEINANEKDMGSHPNGVWSLPPTLAGKDKDRAKFLLIGESDRMTLKFVKPFKK